MQTVSKVGAGFLQDIGSWIWMPRRLEIELSVDGRTFSPVATIANEVSDQEEGVVIRDFVRTISPKNARYVRIRAVNFKEWIFVDEIIIEN